MAQGTTSKDLGPSVLTHVNIDEICNRIIYEWPVPTDYGEGIKFVDFISKASSVYENDTLVYSQIGKKCKDCQFYTDDR